MPSWTERYLSGRAVRLPGRGTPPPTHIVGTDSTARQFPRFEFPEAVALLLVLMVAGLVRLHSIGAQSLWADEGNSWAMATRPLADIAEAVSGDIHPPLYYYLLNLWVRLAGTSEAGLRGLSALFGWLLVLVTYLWARRIASPATALLAGLCAAVSPFAIYYSQEARAYSLMALMAASATLAFTAYLQARSRGADGFGSLILYSLSGAGLLWTHYLGGAVLVLINLSAFAWIAMEAGPPCRARRLRQWLIAQAGVAVLFAPWLPVMLRAAVEWPAISEPRNLGYYLREAARLYTTGPASASLTTWGLICVAVAALGAASSWLRRRDGVAWFLVVAGAVWLPAVMWAMSLVRPAYRAKFLLLGLPAFHILVAVAATTAASALYHRLRRPGAGLWRGAVPAGVACLLLLVPISLVSASGARAVYYDSAYARDDYRAIAAYLAAAADGGDAIILNAPGQVEVFTYYYSGPAQVYPLPLQRPADPEAVIAAMEEIAAKHERVFAVLWATGESDPQSHVETWLNANAYKARDEWYGNVRLAAYELPSGSLSDGDTSYSFGALFLLERVGVGEMPVSPGTAWPVELHWRLDSAVAVDYKLFLQALDANSNIVGQRDVEATSDGRPTSDWSIGQEVVDRQAVPIYLGTPPGSYRVVAGLYDPDTGSRLTLADGSDHVDLGTVEVTVAPRPVPSNAIRPLVRARITLGASRLLGWDASSLGGAPRKLISTGPGQALSVVLYWNVREWTQVDLEFALAGGGSPIVLSTRTLLQGYTLPQGWPADHLVRDPHILVLPGDLQPGRYRLSVTVRTAGGEGTVDLATIEIAGAG